MTEGPHSTSRPIDAEPVEALHAHASVGGMSTRRLGIVPRAIGNGTGRTRRVLEPLDPDRIEATGASNDVSFEHRSASTT